MAIGAVLIARIGHIVRAGEHGNSVAGAAESSGARSVVAFQAHGEYDGPPKQPRIGRAVRRVTGLAAFHAHGRMLEREWSAFIGMALQTSLFIHQLLTDHRGPRRHAPRRRGRAMRIMAIAASHESFIHAVLERHGELRADIGMAAVTELRLAFRQQEFGRSRFVDGVALRAADVVQRVNRAVDIRAGEAFGMATQAGLCGFSWRQQREGADGGFASVRFHVRLAGAMAPFAAGILGLLLFTRDAFEVCVFIETEPDIGVAGFAHCAPDIRTGRRLRLRAER